MSIDKPIYQKSQKSKHNNLLTQQLSNNKMSMPLNQTCPSIKTDWGVQGYRVPLKTQLYISKEYGMPRAKIQSLFIESEKRGKEPGPPAYSPTS